MNIAGTHTSNKTGLVLKISLVLLVLLATVVYKLNDYFKNEKWQSMQSQLRNRVVSIKTTVSGQLVQVKNTLSGYESDLSEANINWVQLDPFFMIAKGENTPVGFKVTQMIGRSNTPAERWNAAYLEKVISINKSAKKNNPITTQMFQDKAGGKFIILRFKSDLFSNREVIVAGGAEYFQKYFDIERGGLSTSLLSTTDGVLAAHTEGDYIASVSKELDISDKKYLIEKQEILGTNLVMMSYVLRKKITSGFAVPMSIVGLVFGIGCVLIGILFYSIDPIERKVERYKKQEREQIYKQTVESVSSNTANKVAQSIPQPALKTPPRTKLPPLPQEFAKMPPPKEEVRVQPEILIQKTTENVEKHELQTQSAADISDTQKINVEKILQQDEENSKLNPQEFLSLEAEKNDLQAIEKALALDDFDNDEGTAKISMAELEKNLTSQKVSVSPTGGPIEKPQFKMEKKKFAVDDFKTFVRRPEKS